MWGCVVLETDRNNCGSCGTRCEFRAECQDGACVCVFATDTLCSGTCTNTQTDSDNCGSCGHNCDWDEYCQAGVCKAYFR
jgi:hypothetical protein